MLIKNILIYVLNMNEGLTGLEQHEGEVANDSEVTFVSIVILKGNSSNFNYVQNYLF